MVLAKKMPAFLKTQFSLSPSKALFTTSKLSGFGGINANPYLIYSFSIGAIFGSYWLYSKFKIQDLSTNDLSEPVHDP